MGNAMASLSELPRAKGGKMHFLRWTTLVTLLCFGTLTCAVTVDAAATPPSNKTVTQQKEKKQTQRSKSTANRQDKTRATSANKETRKDKQSNKHKRKEQAKRTTKSKDKARHASKQDSVAQANKNNKPEWMERASKNTGLLGKASWYGSDFHGGPTASGVPYDMHAYTAAHRTLPMGTVVEVTEENSGRSVMVCISDRGPFTAGRIIDLSYAAATDLGLKNRGVASVNLRVVSDAQGNAMQDEAFYVRLPAKQSSREELVGPFRQFADASVMKEVLRSQYPEAAIVMGPALAKN